MEILHGVCWAGLISTCIRRRWKRMESTSKVLRGKRVIDGGRMMDGEKNDG